MSARLIYDDGATPAPSPAKVVPATPKAAVSLRVILPWVAVAVLFVLVVGAIVAVVVVGMPGAPDVPPSDPLSVATREYIRTFPDAFGEAERGLRDGSIKTKDQLVASLSGHAKPLVKAMDATFADFVDETGNIKDAAKAAEAMARVRVALGTGR